jgi:hypothetical protein
VTVEVNVGTSPGLFTPWGTVHANEYVPAKPGVAVIVAAVPSQTVDELTVTGHCACKVIKAPNTIIKMVMNFFTFGLFSVQKFSQVCSSQQIL